MPIDRRLRIVDAHHHLWDADAYSYPLLQGPSAATYRRYLIDDFLADTSGLNLVQSVHLQGEIGREHSLDETIWLQSIAERHGFPQAIVAYAPLQDPTVGDILAQQARYANVRGIRQILNPDQCGRDDYLTDSQWQAGYRRLADFGMSFDLQADPEQMADAATLAEATPTVPVVINHTGMPRDQSRAGFERWRAAMAAMARLRHVSAKVSGFSMFDRAWTDESIRPYVRTTIDLFGVDRCMFASNFPVDRVVASFERIYESFDHLTSDLSATERDQLFAANAVRIYRL
jgi:predicted TIM-barrel fold metal-dependent hydrolase